MIWPPVKAVHLTLPSPTFRARITPSRAATKASLLTTTGAAGSAPKFVVHASATRSPTATGVPALRNTIPLEECYREAFLDGPTVVNPSGKIPDDDDIPLLLDRVTPCHEVVRIDYHLPGCPPPADAFWRILNSLIARQQPHLPYDLMHFD